MDKWGAEKTNRKSKKYKFITVCKLLFTDYIYKVKV